MPLTTVIRMSAWKRFKSLLNGDIVPPCLFSGEDCEMRMLALCSYQLLRSNVIVLATLLLRLNPCGPRATWRGCDRSVFLGFRDKCE